MVKVERDSGSWPPSWATEAQRGQGQLKATVSVGVKVGSWALAPDPEEG